MKNIKFLILGTFMMGIGQMAHAGEICGEAMYLAYGNLNKISADKLVLRTNALNARSLAIESVVTSNQYVAEKFPGGRYYVVAAATIIATTPLDKVNFQKNMRAAAALFCNGDLEGRF